MSARTLRQLRDQLTALIDGEMGRLYNVGDLPVALLTDDPDPDLSVKVVLCDPQDPEGYASITYE